MEAVTLTDPRYIDTATWALIFTAIDYAFWWAGMMIAGALLFLMAQAIVPSLALTGHVPVAANSFRVFFYLMAIALFALGLTNGVRFISMALEIGYQLYPKLLI
jgi:hypothetical protein